MLSFSSAGVVLRSCATHLSKQSLLTRPSSVLLLNSHPLSTSTSLHVSRVDEGNTPFTKEQEESWQAWQNRYSYEPWYDPNRPIPIHRHPRTDTEIRLKQLERLLPRLYQPSDKYERTRLSEFQRMPEDTMKYKFVIKMGRHTKVTKAGRVQSFSALMVTGNGNGAGAFGYGKGEKPMQAVNRALKDAEKNVFSIQRFEDRTITDIVAHGEYGASKVVFRQQPAGSNVTASNVINEICRAFGITDVSCKIHGSKNMHNVVKAVFKVFFRQRHPAFFARGSGKRFYDPNRVWRNKLYTHSY